jgi:hypothetical protein
MRVRVSSGDGGKVNDKSAKPSPSNVSELQTDFIQFGWSVER